MSRQTKGRIVAVCICLFAVGMNGWFTYGLGASAVRARLDTRLDDQGKEIEKLKAEDRDVRSLTTEVDRLKAQTKHLKEMNEIAAATNKILQSNIETERRRMTQTIQQIISTVLEGYPDRSQPITGTDDEIRHPTEP